MIRISTIFIAICMVLIAASLGLMLYSLAGLTVIESAIIALAALTFLILYNAVSMRLRDRTDVGSQIADLSRGTADLARQVAEFGRRMSAIETRLSATDANGQERVQTVAGEISELGSLVKQLASSVAAHDEILANAATIVRQVAEPAAVASETPPVSTPAANTPFEDTPAATAGAPAADMTPPPATPTNAQLLVAVRNAIEANRIDLFLQPMVTLPQRKVRFYEAVARLRDDNEQLLTANDFVGTAEAAGLMGQIDHTVMLRCVQVLRRLMVRSKDVGVFCNVSGATLTNPSVFGQCLDFLEANRILAPSLVLEFKQDTFRHLGPVESEHLAALQRLGYGFSVDNVTDLRLDPRELADRGVKFIKVPAAMLLDQKQLSTADIHAADLSDLLGRFGIDLVAERIEGERAVVDLLDYDVRFGQGFLFAPPRPLRPEGATTPTEPATSAASTVDAPARKEEKADAKFDARAEAPRVTGNAALARRASAQK